MRQPQVRAGSQSPRLRLSCVPPHAHTHTHAHTNTHKHAHPCTHTHTHTHTEKQCAHTTVLGATYISRNKELSPPHLSLYLLHLPLLSSSLTSFLHLSPYFTFPSPLCLSFPSYIFLTFPPSLSALISSPPPPSPPPSPLSPSPVECDI